MKTFSRSRAGVWLLLALAAPLGAADQLLLINGTVHTANPHAPRAEAVLAIDGRIAFVGSNAEARRRAADDARVLDLVGLTVLPGFADSHAHLAGIGERELSFQLEGTASLAELKQRLREQHGKVAPGEWIIGRGWIESRWTPAAFPTKADLDDIVGERPVLLERADGHAMVVSSRALALAGIDRNTPDPAGGRILKDEKGEPTGMLIDGAMALVTKLVPAPTEQQLLRQLETGASRSVRAGWTQLQIAGNSFAEVDRLCRLYAAGRIKLRVYDAIDGPGPDAERLGRRPEVRRQPRDERRGNQRGVRRRLEGQAEGYPRRHPPAQRLDRFQPRPALLHRGPRPDQGDGRQLRLGAFLVRQ